MFRTGANIVRIPNYLQFLSTGASAPRYTERTVQRAGVGTASGTDPGLLLPPGCA